MAFPQLEKMADGTMKHFLLHYLLIILILHILAIVYVFDIHHYLSFEWIKEHHILFRSYINEHPILLPICFILGYILFAALSLPGIVFLSLLGGYLFPQPWSTLYSIFSLTCGACLLFLALRLALGPAIKKVRVSFFKKMEKGFQKNAASYMISLRFSSIFPIWILNAVPAFFQISLKTFAWTTLVGVIPETIIYTTAGMGIEKFFTTNQQFSIDSIFNTQVKIALILLAMLVLVPPMIERYRKYKR